MPNDQELISQLRLAMEQARRCAAQLREAGWTVHFNIASSDNKATPYQGNADDVAVLIERTTREEHKL